MNTLPDAGDCTREMGRYIAGDGNVNIPAQSGENGNYKDDSQVYKDDSQVSKMPYWIIRMEGKLVGSKTIYWL